MDNSDPHQQQQPGSPFYVARVRPLHFIDTCSCCRQLYATPHGMENTGRCAICDLEVFALEWANVLPAAQ